MNIKAEGRTRIPPYERKYRRTSKEEETRQRFRFIRKEQGKTGDISEREGHRPDMASIGNAKPFSGRNRIRETGISSKSRKGKKRSRKLFE